MSGQRFKFFPNRGSPKAKGGDVGFFLKISAEVLSECSRLTRGSRRLGCMNIFRYWANIIYNGVHAGNKSRARRRYEGINGNGYYEDFDCTRLIFMGIFVWLV